MPGIHGILVLLPMPGFFLQFFANPSTSRAFLKLVDLGESNVSGWWKQGPVMAAWTHWEGHPQFHVWRHRNRLLWLEGQPDRLPGQEESIAAWLKGRWGSYRGVEIRCEPNQPVGVTAFVDPLGTRPLYYRITPEGFSISDKLATLAANERCAIDWAPVLETMVLASAYSGGVSLRGAAALRPGQEMAFEDGKPRLRATHAIPADGDIREAEVREAPAKALLRAHRKAVEETWTDRESFLMLSGGLDSRFALALAGPDRLTLNVTTRPNRESRLAEEIARACGARFRHWPRPEETYYGILRNAPVLSGALSEPHVAHHLGLGTQWRKQGIRSIAHAFLYDTVLKGWFTIIDQPYACCNPMLQGALGEVERCFQHRSGRSSVNAPDDVLRMLSEEGRELALSYLKNNTRPQLPVTRAEGYDMTLERAILSFLSRQLHYPILLGWMEELAVSTPIAHPAFWTWYAHSRPRDRQGGKMFREALLLLDHPVTKVRDANTGAAIARQKEGLRDMVRRAPLYRTARKILLKMRTPDAEESRVGSAPPEDEGSWPHIATICRTAGGRAVVEEGLDRIAGHAMFDGGQLRENWKRLLDGEDRPLEPVLGAMTAGRWRHFVENMGEGDSRVRNVPLAEPA